jgi:hypothetical protein
MDGTEYENPPMEKENTSTHQSDNQLFSSH